MRPIELKMQAFGPYRDLVQLDFTEFGNHSIFLVNGPTGSGKTTIFDAISYALFNRASGESRETDMMKSDFATDENLSFVELTFEMKNKTYRVFRSPKQRGPGERVKVRDYQSNVEFYREEYYLANGMEANQQISELIGLNYDQFRQIVLLPQGEFRQLLISNSQDKEKIFRNIFGTQKIENFQQYLKEKRSEYKKKYQVYETRLNQNLETINIKSIESLDEKKYKDLKNAITTQDYEKVLELMEWTLQKDDESFTQINKELTQINKKERSYQELRKLLNEQIELDSKKKELSQQKEEIQEDKINLEMDKNARKLEKENKKLIDIREEKSINKQKINRNIEQQQKLEKEIKNLEIKETNSNKNEKKLEKLRNNINSYDLELEKFKEISDKKDSIKNTEIKKTNLLKQLRNQEKNEKELIKRIQLKKDKINKVSYWREELEENRKAKDLLTKRIENKRENKIFLLEITELQKKLEKLNEENKFLYENYQKSVNEYRCAREDYFDNLAGILSRDLVENQACPVCGSKKHPSIASDTKNNFSKEKLEQLEKNKEVNQLQYEKNEIEIEKTSEQIHEKISLIKKNNENQSVKRDILKKELAKLNDQLDNYEEKKQETEKNILFLEKKIKNENNWREELERMQDELQEIRISISEINKDYSNRKIKIEECLNKINDIQKKLTANSEEELEENKLSTHKEIKEIEKTAKEIQESLNSVQNEKAGIKSRIKLLIEQDKKIEENKGEQKKQLERLFKKYNLNSNFSKLILDNEESTRLAEKIKKYDKENDYTIRQLKQVNNKLKKYKNDTLKKEKNIEKYLLELNSKKESLEIKRDEIIREISSHENSYKEIKKNFEESQELYLPFQMYSDLAEVANGSNKRTNYISFERYLLSIYFSEILNAANKRFVKMTNDRYKLVRRDRKTKGQGAEGLEIDVFDRYSGKKRSVKSLSGGETFKASLALALGLSDVIQSQKGGVEINTLFIDEGFGTLDTDSLEMAIETLMELQSSGRLIGVISHVEELKDRIPARILVESVREGSYARIEID